MIILSDLDVGMNECLSEPLAWDDSRRYDRGKVLDQAQLDALEDYGRYLDVDGDAITYRTLPGTHPEKGAFFTRGTSRDEYAIYTEKGDAYERNMQRLTRKWANAPDYLPKPLMVERDANSRRGVICYGTSTAAVDEALDTLAASGLALNRLQLRSIPFHEEVRAFIEQHDQVFVVEQNRDAQMRQVLINELSIDPARLVPLLHYNGTPISAEQITKPITELINPSDNTAVAGGQS